jgi:hypothetical protein
MRRSSPTEFLLLVRLVDRLPDHAIGFVLTEHLHEAVVELAVLLAVRL